MIYLFLKLIQMKSKFLHRGNYLIYSVFVIVLLLLPKTHFGQSPDLGTANNFAVFTEVGAFDNVGASNVTGDIGTNVGALTGFPPGTLTGEIHVADAVSVQAALDVEVAYTYLSTLTCGSVIGTTLGSGQILTPNVYCTGAASTLNGDLILDGQGNPDAIFIIQIDGALATGTFASVTLINEASVCNVYWQINGAFTLGDFSVFRGTIVNNGAIHLLEGASLYGKALSRAGAIDLHNNLVVLSSEPVASVITAGGSTSFCAGGSVVLSGNTGGTWSTGATTPTITVTTAGDYFVTNTNNCGTINSNHIIVNINPPPTASIITAGGPTAFCTGGNVILSGNVGGTWSTGATTPTITVTTAGDYFVTNTNDCGSVTSNHIIVTIDPAPTASIITAGGPTAFCAGGNVVLSGNVGGTWSTGASTPTITVTTAGDYFVTNTNACGSVTSNHIIVTINPAPTASIITAGGPTAFCTGGNVILSGNVGGTWSTGATTPTITVTTAGDYFVTNTNDCGSVTSNHIIVTIDPAPTASIITAGGPTAFCAGGNVVLSGNVGGTWSTGASTPTITVTTAGDYFVTNTNACGSVTSNHIIVTINPAPTASIITAGGPTAFCTGGSVILSGNVGGTWSTGASTPTITVTTAGDYFVTNTNDCGSVTSNHIIVTISAPPTASIITAGGPTAFCAGGSVILSGNVGGTWSTGATTPTITVTTAGDYFVTNSNACGTINSNHIIVTINPAPTASIITAGGPIAFCAGGNVVLSGNVGGTWSTGATTPTITVTTAGDYFVTNTNACGTINSNHIIVTISAPPTASTITAGGPIKFCPGASVVLSGNVGGTWSTGATTPTITVTTAGDYFVTNSNACGTINSNHIIVTIKPLPTASVITASGPTAFCAGGSVILSGNVGGTWSTGASTPTITVTTAGDYFVTNTNACGSVTSNHIIVTISAPPTASIITAGGPTAFCTGGSVILSGNVGGTWSTGASTPTITVTTAGDYFVTNTNACGTIISNHIIVTINPAPTASIIAAGGPTAFCTGGSVILSGNVGGTWSTGAATPTITVTTAGDYFVTNTNACGSVTSNHIIVTIAAPPTASIITAGGPIKFCPGGSVVLSGNVGGTWSTGATTPTITVTAAGDYFVTNTNACGTIISNHIIVTFKPLPTASVITASGPIAICTGGSVILSGNVGGTWSTGAATSTITVTTAGDYFVTNTNACGSVTSNHIIVTFAPTPTASIITAGGPIKFCPGGSVVLSGNVGGTWSTGATTPTITVTAAGDYFVTNSNACGTIISNHIIVTLKPLPTASVITASGPIAICTGGSVILSGNVGGTWSTGAATSTITVTTAGDYFVTNTNACGSVTSNHIIVTFAPTPTASIITAGGPIKFCPGGSVVLSGNVGGTWSTGATTPTITVTTAGDYFVTNTNACGSVTSNHIIVTIKPLPTASVITASGPTAICTGGSVILSGNVGGTWSTGATTSTITVTTAGDYFVTNTNACGSVTSNHIIVTIAAPPTASIITAGGPIAFCIGGNVVLSGNTGGTWSTGATTPTITVTTAGDYFVTNTNACGTVTSNHIIITVYPLPFCNITGDASICEGESTHLCAPAECTSFLWNTGATTGCINVTESGTYTVTVTNGGGCVSTCSKTVVVTPLPTASIITASGATTFCAGGSILLSGNIGGTWNTGSTSASLIVNASGDYFVTNTNACGSTISNHIIVTVNPLPLCNITGDASICFGETTNLCATPGLTSYLWSTGATTGCITVSGAGTYTVTGTNAFGCVSTCSKTVTLYAEPIASVITASGATTFCAGGSILLSGNVGGTWSTGSTAASLIVNASGDYFVTNTTGCGSVISNHIIVTVNPLPVCYIGGDNSICVGESTNLCAPPGLASYLWSTGATTECITISTAGTYTLTITDANGCVSTCSKTVTLYAEPVASVITASGATTFCAGGSILLSGNVGGTWNTGSTAASLIVNASGDYYVTNTTGCGSVNSNHIIVTVNPLPVCYIGGDNSICAGETTNLCAPPGLAAYLWNTGATTQCITVSTAGTYTLTITNANGCVSTCSKTVTLYAAPVASVITASGSTTFCAGGSILLSGNVGGTWNTGSTAASLIVNASGDYYVTNTTGCGSVNSNHIIVTVNPLPVCNIGGDNSICVGESTTLCATAGYASYLWSTGATSSCISVSVSGTYTVTITTASGCTSTCSKTVTVYPAPVLSVITASGPTTICSGENITLSGNSGGIWNTGATTASITVNTSGDYFVTSTTGCGSLTSNHIIVTVNPAPICTITGDTCICVGEIVTLCAPTGFASYLWSTGATTRCINVGTIGMYSVTVTDENGCSSTCYQEVTEGPFRLGAGNSTYNTGKLEVKVYPNPFNSTATFEFQNATSNAHVVIEIYNVMGTRINTLFNGDILKGMLNTVEIKGDDLSAGVYIYRIYNGEQIINGELVLIK